MRREFRITLVIDNEDYDDVHPELILEDLFKDSNIKWIDFLDIKEVKGETNTND